jgi:hypothetical protein
MSKHRFRRGHSTYICQLCHKETRDTNGEEASGLCLRCYQISEWENLHSDDDHEGEFHKCEVCLPFLTMAELVDHLPYFIGEKSYPTI